MTKLLKKDINNGQLVVSYLVEDEQKTILSLPIRDVQEFHLRAYRKEQHRLQFLTGRSLLAEMFDQIGYCGIKCIEGVPQYIEEVAHHMSLSHSDQLVTAYISKEPVGVDIQKVVPRIANIAPRIFHEEELLLAKSLTDQAIIWAAKEALYKYWKKEGVEFSSQLRIHHIKQEEHYLSLEVTLIDGPDARPMKMAGEILSIKGEDYVLVYTT